MKTTLSVTVDKSHIITIGEKLYTESIELIRELVNNAYDADATLVEVLIIDDYIQIKDNGAGMDMDGLKQYFNIGSQEKAIKSISPLYKRSRIGQFGIGKFASLSACNKFVLYTQKNDFAGRVTFDKEMWSQSTDNWEIPLETIQPDPNRENGTTITLMELRRNFNLDDVKRVIVEGVPLNAPNFFVKLNGSVISPTVYVGHKIPVNKETPHGKITGEIVILPVSHGSTKANGIEIKVKQVTVKRELFWMEGNQKALEVIKGHVNADFLPLTSDRSGFIIDTDEYKTFIDIMQQVMEEVKVEFQKFMIKGEKIKLTRALKEALLRVEMSLMHNPDISPYGPLPIPDKKEPDAAKPEGSVPKETIPAKKTKKRGPRVKKLTPDAIIKRMKFIDGIVSCCLDHFGEDGPESFFENSIIYINVDSPLYKREMKKGEAHVLNLTRLITQELTLMKEPPRDPRKAFERQSRLMRDAFRDKE
jgi:hypothetical protein